jgi:ornithine cyclodeaminase/alanine dehydrogenase
MPKVIEAVEEALREKALGRTIMPAKHWLAPNERRFYSAMTSIVASSQAVACKWQSGSSDNLGLGLPYLTGLLILNDDRTGMPVAIMDSTWITAKRTAAATAVTARYLAKPSARTLAMIGCGVQGRTNAESLRIVLPELRCVRAYDVSREALDRYVTDVGRQFDLEVIPCASAREAIRGADVVVTGGPIEPMAPRTIDTDWLEPGMLGVALDYDCYWKPTALKAANRFFTDDVPQLEHLREYGYFRDTPPTILEIGDVVAGKVRRREHPEEVIVAMNLGISVEDVTTARRVYDLAVKLRRGTRLPL